MICRALLTVAIAVVALTGCSADKAPSPAASSEAAAAGPDAKPGLSASGGRLVLPAVKGNPGVAYVSVTNGDAADATISAVFVSDASRAELHETKAGSMAPMQTVAVPAGQTVLFEPGGKHVMVFDIADTVKAGDSAELTFTFADGDKLSVPLQVEARGAMEGTGHGAGHSPAP